MKTYEKPILNEIEFAPNQAIAACAVTDDVMISAIGYRCQWDGASMSDNAELEEHVKSAHGNVEVPESALPYCYKVEQINGDGYFRWEDFNRNGVYDAGDNWQDVHWPNVPQALMNS